MGDLIYFYSDGSQRQYNTLGLEGIDFEINIFRSSVSITRSV